MLEDYGVCHFEEPCPYWELEWTKEVADALDVAVTGGEQDCELATWRRMIDMRAVDVVQPDVCYLGGLTRTLRVVAMAQAAGLPGNPALGQPVAGHGLHAPHDGRDRGRRALRRVLDRGARPLSVAGRAVCAGAGGAGRQGREFRTGPDGASRSTRTGSRTRPTSAASSTEPWARSRVPGLSYFRHKSTGSVRTPGVVFRPIETGRTAMTDDVRAGAGSGVGYDLAHPAQDAGGARPQAAVRAARCLLGAAAVAALTLACGSAGAADSKAASATSAADLGGMDRARRGRQEGRRAERHRAAARLGQLWRR